MDLEYEIKKLIRARRQMEAKIGDIDAEIEHILVRLENDPRLAFRFSLDDETRKGTADDEDIYCDEE